jgi:hypothetical protein
MFWRASKRVSERLGGSGKQVGGWVSACERERWLTRGHDLHTRTHTYAHALTATHASTQCTCFETEYAFSEGCNLSHSGLQPFTLGVATFHTRGCNISHSELRNGHSQSFWPMTAKLDVWRSGRESERINMRGSGVGRMQARAQEHVQKNTCTGTRAHDRAQTQQRRGVGVMTREVTEHDATHPNLVRSCRTSPSTLRIICDRFSCSGAWFLENACSGLQVVSTASVAKGHNIART